ncbi:hypothetical protein GPICK_07540 [Geobacter pickeringii]|uniref:Histidine kinase domain-containing protein n=1 Tax=Geobacter pickeringii TaxID=345632 RepID=A0A0B5B919_9BACT|nr:hypothetical protein GPICK_07540 [Geobacter pickeringii]
MANIIVGASVALFVYFLKGTTILENGISYLIALLFAFNVTLIKNKIHYAPSYLGTVLDGVMLVGTALLWTYVRRFSTRLLAVLGLSALLVPVTLLIFRYQGILVSTLLVVLGIAFVIMVEGVVDFAVRRFRSRLLNEKQDAEFSIIRHLTHNVKPNIQIARSPIVAVTDYLAERKMLDEALAMRLDGTVETVGEALRNALSSLARINDILDSTRKLVTQEIRREEFEKTDLRQLFTDEILPGHSRTFAVGLDCPPQLVARIHRGSFVEAMNNIIRNAAVHGYPDGAAGAELCFRISETRKRIVIDYTNNGRPFPANLSVRDFLSFGIKSAESPGEGLGGAWIGKVIEAHSGRFEIIRDHYPVHFRIFLPKGGS